MFFRSVAGIVRFSLYFIQFGSLDEQLFDLKSNSFPLDLKSNSFPLIVQIGHVPPPLDSTLQNFQPLSRTAHSCSMVSDAIGAAKTALDSEAGSTSPRGWGETEER